MSDARARDELDAEAVAAFGAACYQPVKDALQTLCAETEDHKLPASRMEHAIYVAACIVCDYSALLEGPAAVGKTSLVQALSSQWQAGRRSDGQPRELERVNNTASTTIQDYLGTYVPSGDTFVFQPGALYRAMVNGDFFLADEYVHGVW
jgi:MoxR-like ATPase